MTACASALAFLAAAVTLVLQILVHRLVSAKLLNNFAFVVISLTMLGFAFSGVVLSLWRPLLLRRRAEVLAACASLFVLSTLAASAFFYQVDVGAQVPDVRQGFVLPLARWMPLALPHALPFACSGLMLGLLLASPDLPASRIYFFDLLGSAAGCVLVIPAIAHAGVEWSLIGACAAMLAGTLALAPPRRVAVRAAAAAAALALAASAAWLDRVFDLRYPTGSMLAAAAVPGSGWAIEHVAWDPVSRIEVTRIPPPDPSRMGYPALIGSRREFLDRFRRILTQNNYAFTFAVDYDGRLESLEGIEQTLYAAAYEASSVARPRVAVIGVGGGFDVLTALRYDASAITALEVNGATVEILTRTYRDYFRHWVDDPRLRLLRAEGRHFLATSAESFDVIQLSGVDSYSGSPGAAHVFSENYLYTSEAFDLYLSRLTDQGILNMMRLEFVPPREMLRALVTAVSALRRAGVQRPAEHLVMLTATDGHFTAMLVKRRPFSDAERERVSTWAAKSPFFAVSAGASGGAAPVAAYQDFLSLADPRREAAFVAAYPVDISPTVDDRPFFFRYSLWRHLLSPVLRSSLPLMEWSVLLLLGVLGTAAVVCIYAPLRFFSARGLRHPAAARYAVFFAGIGVGYMAIEIALLQKFGLLLGHPNYALSVVLAALLVSTGLGSLLCAKIVSRLGELRYLSYVLSLAVLLEYGFLLAELPGLIRAPFAARSFLVCALVTPIGVCLGAFLPSGLERLKREAPELVPWAWGINGIFSVLGPVVAVAFSMTFGASALLLAAIPAYLAAALALPAPGADS